MKFTAILALVASAAAIRISKKEPTHSLEDLAEHAPISITQEDFDQLDQDGSGEVDKKELRAALKHFGVVLTKEDRKNLMKYLSGGDGKITFDDANAALAKLHE